MNSTCTAILFATQVLGAPAPKEPPLVHSMVDRLPDDTAAIMVVNMDSLTKTPFGKQLVEVVGANGPNLPWLDVKQISKEIELAVVGQFAIEKFFGDVCFLLRFRDGSEIPKKLKDSAQGKPFEIGKVSAHVLHKDGICFAILDRNTVAVVLLQTNSQKPDLVKEGLEAVFGEKRTGPRKELRKLIKEIDPKKTIAIVSEHPKSANSAMFAFMPFVNTNGLGEEFQGRVVRFHLGIAIDEKADVQAQVEFTDAATAEIVQKVLDKNRTKKENKPWPDAIAQTMEISRDNEKIHLRGSISPKLLDLLLPKK
jgi:hypothetical protein